METNRTNFSLFDIPDIEEVLEMYADYETFKYIGPLLGLTREQYISRLHIKLKEIADGKGFHWISRSKKDNHLVGMLNLNPMPGSSRMFIGYQIRRHLWGQGYGIELAHKIVEYAFNTMKYDEIFAIVEQGNNPSQRIIQNLGFKLFESKKQDGIVLYTFRLDNES